MRHTKMVYGALIVVAGWFLLTAALGARVFPGPIETVRTFVLLLPKGLLIHLAASLMRIIVALALSLLAGIPLGLLMGMHSRLDKILAPVAYILYPLPKIAFLPVFMILFGLGNSAKIILIFTIIVFQILLATRDGVKEIPQRLFYSVQSLGLGRLQTYRHLVVPAVIPRIFSALRVTIGIGISVLFFAENFATQWGIGYFIMNAWAMVNYPDMFAGILALGLMGLLIFGILDVAERRACGWLFVNKEESNRI